MQKKAVFNLKEYKEIVDNPLKAYNGIQSEVLDILSKRIYKSIFQDLKPEQQQDIIEIYKELKPIIIQPDECEFCHEKVVKREMDQAIEELKPQHTTDHIQPDEIVNKWKEYHRLNSF